MSDISNLERNTILLKKAIKYLPNGTTKETVEMQIKENYELIDEFFDNLAEEYKFISSYEQ
mgnify:CR=1 FL=1